MQNKIELSIVIPCYNESQSLKELIIKCENIVSDIVEIIIVDNGSTDNSSKILDKITTSQNLNILKLKKNLGYGGGIIEGLKKTKGEIVGWTHADLQTDPKEAVDAFVKNKTLLYNNNLVKGLRKNRNYFDLFFTFSMSLYVYLVLKLWLFDINAQPKLFSREILNKIDNPPLDFSLDLYILYFVKKNKFNIITYPVNFPNRKFGKSKGGGSLLSKIKLTYRTIKFTNSLKKLY